MSQFSIILVLVLLLGLRAPAQPVPKGADLMNRMDSINGETTALSSPEPAKSNAEKKKTEPAQNGPTEITATKETTYDEKTHKAVFYGDVHVNDPQFKITCDQLTAFLHDSSVPTSAAGGAKPGAKAKASPSAAGSPSPKTSPGASPAPSPAGGGGLKRAIAEGHVFIIQDKPAADGQAAQHNTGKCQKADYNAETGDVVLTGWPQVQQGLNMQIATEESTIMIMNRDGRTMKTKGASKTVIQDQPDTAASPIPKRS